MKVVRFIRDFENLPQGRIGLVPTMGAFHEGHLHLMRQARKECDIVVTSLFVNPTQFGPNEDFARYPRDEQRDIELADSVGVDIFFAPGVDEIYPSTLTSINVEGVTTRWEGAYRPTHFSGVCTIVCKLFNIVTPHVAFFGLKDYQQCAVIQTMVEDLNMHVELRFIETVREPNGLAMSSRNRYLSEEEREVAANLYAHLTLAASILRSKAPCDQATIDKHVGNTKQDLEKYGFSVDYLALVDRKTLEPLSRLTEEARLITAARLGSVRLIDNVKA